jgi:hypothetical protein
MHLNIDQLKLEETIEYSSDIEIYYNKTKDILKYDNLRSNQKFKTNKNLLETIADSPEQKTHFSKSPRKKSQP